MLVNWIRKYIGGVRLALTLLVILLGALVVMLDLLKKLNLSMQAYGFLGSMLGVVAVFIWKDTQRPVNLPETPKTEETKGDA